MTWYFPILSVAVAGLMAWEMRDVVKLGRVKMRGFEFDEAKTPVRFWFCVAVNMFVLIVALVAVLLWAIDYNGLRS